MTLVCFSVLSLIFSMEIEKTKKNIQLKSVPLEINQMGQKVFFYQSLPVEIWLLIMDMLANEDSGYKYLLMFFPICQQRAKTLVDSIEYDVFRSSSDMIQAVADIKKLAFFGKLRLAAVYNLEGSISVLQRLVRLPPINQKVSYEMVKQLLEARIKELEKFLQELTHFVYSLGEMEVDARYDKAARFFSGFIKSELLMNGYDQELASCISQQVARDATPVGYQGSVGPELMKSWSNELDKTIVQNFKRLIRLNKMVRLERVFFMFRSLMRTSKLLVKQLEDPDRETFLQAKRKWGLLLDYVAIPCGSLFGWALSGDEKFLLLNSISVFSFGFILKVNYNWRLSEYCYDIVREAKSMFELAKLKPLKSPLTYDNYLMVPYIGFQYLYLQRDQAIAAVEQERKNVTAWLFDNLAIRGYANFVYNGLSIFS